MYGYWRPDCSQVRCRFIISRLFQLWKAVFNRKILQFRSAILNLIYEQMIGAGCVRKLVFSWAGNPGAGALYALRRSVEEGLPHPIELEEYSHFGMVARFTAGAAKLLFFPLRPRSGHCHLNRHAAHGRW